MSSFRSLPKMLRAPLRSACAPRQTLSQPATVFAYHTSRYLQLPYKDDQDRESVKPRSNEGTKSSDDDAVAQTDTAFDPSTTSPEAEKDSANQEHKHKSGTSPLESSGANQGGVHPEGGKGEMKEATKSERNKASRSGSPEKKGKGPAA